MTRDDYGAGRNDDGYGKAIRFAKIVEGPNTAGEYIGRLFNTGRDFFYILPDAAERIHGGLAVDDIVEIGGIRKSEINGNRYASGVKRYGGESDKFRRAAK